MPGAKLEARAACARASHAARALTKAFPGACGVSVSDAPCIASCSSRRPAGIDAHATTRVEGGGSPSVASPRVSYELMPSLLRRRLRPMRLWPRGLQPRGSRPRGLQRRRLLLGCSHSAQPRMVQQRHSRRASTGPSIASAGSGASAGASVAVGYKGEGTQHGTRRESVVKGGEQVREMKRERERDGTCGGGSSSKGGEGAAMRCGANV